MGQDVGWKCDWTSKSALFPLADGTFLHGGLCCGPAKVLASSTSSPQDSKGEFPVHNSGKIFNFNIKLLFLFSFRSTPEAEKLFLEEVWMVCMQWGPWELLNLSRNTFQE